MTQLSQNDILKSKKSK